MAKNRKGYYGVREGRIRGVYDNWESCKAQVEECANQYRRFDTYEEAAFYVATGQSSSGNKGRALSTKQKRTQRSGISSNIAKKEEKPRVKVEAFDASQSYFSQVPNFMPDDNADFDDEFGRFASSQNIEPGSQDWRRKRTDAIRHEMVFHYSQRAESDNIKEEDVGLSEEEKLQVFQNMCREVDLKPLDTIDGCVSNLKSVLVNIVDYIDAKRNRRPIKVWGPHEFEEFKEYTLSDEKRIDLHVARGGDGLLEPLLQVLRADNAAHVYQGRRRRAAIAQDHEVISIREMESDYSLGPQPIKEEIVDIGPWSPSSIGSSVIEILINSQSGTKRDLDDLIEGQDTLTGSPKSRTKSDIEQMTRRYIPVLEGAMGH